MSDLGHLDGSNVNCVAFLASLLEQLGEHQTLAHAPLVPTCCLLVAPRAAASAPDELCVDSKLALSLPTHTARYRRTDNTHPRRTRARPKGETHGSRFLRWPCGPSAQGCEADAAMR